MKRWLRLPEWLWRASALDTTATRLLATAPAQAARVSARLALELGKRSEAPSEPFGPAPNLAAACGHYARAIEEALEALTTSAAPSAEERPRPAAPPLAAEHLAIAQAAGGDEAQGLAWRIALARSEAEVAALAAPEQARAAQELRTLATKLVDAACADETALQRLRRQRRRRVGTCAVVVAFGVYRTALALDGTDLRTDLASGKPWRASSSAYVCDPVARRCGNHVGMSIFFHTAEDPSPWLVIDLEKEETISAVRVRNRTDCCSAAAIPLVLELSLDGQEWQEVARREQNFRNWVASFTPRGARWVRLRVDRKSMLHLERVSVYR